MSDLLLWKTVSASVEKSRIFMKHSMDITHEWQQLHFCGEKHFENDCWLDDGIVVLNGPSRLFVFFFWLPEADVTRFKFMQHNFEIQSVVFFFFYVNQVPHSSKSDISFCIILLPWSVDIYNGVSEIIRNLFVENRIYATFQEYGE